ncbi:MAG: hypothetical protein J5586_00050 [Clostridia bacterium]|nr:hypothetical protein [Clostridia bacterium]
MKKLLPAVLSVILLFCSLPAAASSKESGEDFDPNKYVHHTIYLTDNGKASSPEGQKDTIDTAIEYVKSLDLTSSGYSIVEEACLAELDAYRSCGVQLESYTVLTPKRSMTYFGTYLGYDYYCDYTSVSNMRRETNGISKTAANVSDWDNWVIGIINVALCFADPLYSIPFSLISSVVSVPGPSSISYGSHNRYVEQFTNTVTRTVYKKLGSTYKRCYQDQFCFLRIKLYFCPVGSAFSSDFYDIGTLYDRKFRSNDWSIDRILRAAHVYSNHGGDIIFTVSSQSLREIWGN